MVSKSQACAQRFGLCQALYYLKLDVKSPALWTAKRLNHIRVCVEKDVCRIYRWNTQPNSRVRKSTLLHPSLVAHLAFLCCCTEEALPARGGRGANDFHCWRVHRCGLRGNILYATSTWFLFKARLAFSLVIVYLGFCMRRPCRVVVADQSLRSICRYHGPRFVQLLVRPGRSELCFLFVTHKEIMYNLSDDAAMKG